MAARGPSRVSSPSIRSAPLVARRQDERGLSGRPSTEARRAPGRGALAGLYLLALTSYVAFGAFVAKQVFNWIVGPLWFFVVIYVVPAWLRRRRDR